MADKRGDWSTIRKPAARESRRREAGRMNRHRRFSPMMGIRNETRLARKMSGRVAMATGPVL
jgi:hypothetical protein